MRKTKLLVLAAVAVLMFGSIAQAGDYATLNFVGFSKDGRYLAFEEYGVQDGSGFPYSSFYFVDVTKNSFAAPSINIRLDNEQANENQARSRAKLKAATILSRLRITKVKRAAGRGVVVSVISTAYDAPRMTGNAGTRGRPQSNLRQYTSYTEVRFQAVIATAAA